MQDELRSYIKSNGERVEKHIARGEIMGLLLCLIGIFMMMQKFAHHAPLMITGLSLLAFVYAFHGNFLADIFEIKEQRFLVLSLRASYIALAVTTLGILFKLQNWTGGSYMLLAGCAASGVFFLFFVYKLFLGKLEDEQMRILINNLIVRMLPALLIVAFLVTSVLYA